MVYIIDGKHLAYRSYYGIDELRTSYGKCVKGIFGFVQTIRMYLRRFKGDTILIAWDGEGETENHKLCENYKAGRSKAPDEFYEQLPEIQPIMSAIGIPQYEIAGVEADDIIGSLTYIARRKQQKVVILSSDHDFEQLITKHVKVIVPSLAAHKEKVKDVDYVVEKYGLRPNQLVELMSLTGDGSDNVGGIEGIGDKTGCKLLKANGGLRRILEAPELLKTFDRKGNLKDAPPKLRDKIKDGIEQIKIANKVVQIDTTLDLMIPSKRKPVDRETLESEFKRLEFEKFLKEIDKWTALFEN